MSSDVAELELEVGGAPAEWRQVTLGKVVRIVTDGISAADLAALPEVHHYSLPAFDEGAGPEVGPGDTIKSNKTLVPDDCVLFSKLNLRIPRIWRVRGDAPSHSYCSTKFWPLVAQGSGVDLDYLTHYLSSAAFLGHPDITPSSSTNSHQRVDRKSFEGFEFVLPPLEEQRRIAEVLRSVDEAIAATLATNKQAQIALESARTNLLMPLADTTALGDVCNVIGGYAFKSTSFIESGVKVLRISNITEGGVDFSGRAVCVAEQDVRGLDRFRLRPLDTVVALSGATTGKMCVFTFDEPVYANQRVAFIRVKEGLADQGYINHVLSMLTASVRQSAYGGAQPNISTKEIAAMEIALPRLAEQHEIAEVLDGLSQAVALGDQVLIAQQATKATLMSDLLSGNVRVPA